MKTNHILIMRFSALGDVAMMVPVVWSLARQYPHLRITVLSKPFARPFFENIADNVGFMAADVKKEYHGVRGLNTLYRRLIAKHFTAIADFHDVLRTKFLRLRFDLSRHRVAHINKHRYGKRKLTAANGKILIQQPTSFENYAEVLDKLGYPVKLEFTSIFPEGRGDWSLLNDNSSNQNNENTIAPKKENEKWIGVAPFAAHAGKIYPLKKTEEIISKLHNQYPNSRIFLFGGGEKELAVLDRWTQQYKRCTCVARAIKGLGKELILMSYLDVMVSMDSANMHLASLTGIPVVSIWGATHPYAGFMGWNQQESNAIQVDLPCRPCSIYGNKPCMRGDLACLNNIEPDTVLKTITMLLERNN